MFISENKLYNNNRFKVRFVDKMDYKQKYQEFIGSLNHNGKESAARQAKAFLSIGEYDYTNCDDELIKKVVLDCNPKSGEKSVTTIIQVMIKYAKFINDQYLVSILKNADRKEIWDAVKEKAPRRFISNKEFEKTLSQILKSESTKYRWYNAEYYAALFWCVYEGIYSKDYGLLKNVRASNINKTTVVTYDGDKNEYKFVLPQKLINMLLNLSLYTDWETSQGGYKMIGLYNDSCFKITQRPPRKNNGTERATDSYRTNYRNKLTTLCKDCLNRCISPQEIYISGIMHRIILRAQQEGINWKDIFEPNNKNRFHSSIIAQELQHSYYNKSVRNFREMVKNYLDVFDE